MPSLSTVENVVGLLQRRAIGLGTSIAEIRRLYPAKSVRRSSILESLRLLEDLELIEWLPGRIRWRGPIPMDSRPLGVKFARAERDAALQPQERIIRMVELSEALISERRRSNA